MSGTMKLKRPPASKCLGPPVYFINFQKDGSDFKNKHQTTHTNISTAIAHQTNSNHGKGIPLETQFCLLLLLLHLLYEHLLRAPFTSRNYVKHNTLKKLNIQRPTPTSRQQLHIKQTQTMEKVFLGKRNSVFGYHSDAFSPLIFTLHGTPPLLYRVTASSKSSQLTTSMTKAPTAISKESMKKKMPWQTQLRFRQSQRRILTIYLPHLHYIHTHKRSSK